MGSPLIDLKAAAVAKANPNDLVEIIDVEQGTDDWKILRIGIPTASRFATMMASGKDGGKSESRAKLLYVMAGEILTQTPAETFVSKAMDRGREMEPEALEHYAFTRDVEVTRVGFVRRTIRKSFNRDLIVGCSPDGLISTDGIVQTKTMQPDLLIELLEQGRFPTKHRAQCQGELWVTGRQWCDLKIFYRGMPVSPVFHVERDDGYIKEIAEAVEVFDYELRKLVERIRNMGGKS